jgi:hypothetical protein
MELNQELIAAYLDGFFGLVRPFPRLDALRANPHLICDFDEIMELMRKESKYLEAKRMAQQRFHELTAIDD